MPTVVRFPAPRIAELADESRRPLGPAEVRIRTAHSGISAGTELTAYRGSNPYLSRSWDPARRLFLDGGSSLRFPVVGWGYEEAGEVVEVAPDAVGVAVGDRVWGAWGHRSETVMAADQASRQLLPPEVDLRHGVFAKIGAIALNAVHDAELGYGDTVAVFGLGVPGQLAAQLARRSGARVIGVDLDPRRRALARKLGASEVLDPMGTDVAVAVRELTAGRGADVAIEISGSSVALHEAIRTVGYNARVVVSGFHQGAAQGLRLGEEFHHNRVALVCSQISGVAVGRQHRWDEARLASTAIAAIATGDLVVEPLLTHRFAAADAAEAFRLLDAGDPDVMQVVLDFVA